MSHSLRLLLSAVPVLGLCAAAGCHAAGSFHAKAVTHTGRIRLAAAIDVVFPLFGPVLEKRWAAGWEPHIVSPAGSDVAEGMVFTVAERQSTAYWVITQYDPGQYTIAYANVIPGRLVNRIVIHCRALGADETEATVTYAHVALDEHGNTFIEQMDAKAYAAKMQHWQEAITYALNYGHPMPRPH